MKFLIPRCFDHAFLSPSAESCRNPSLQPRSWDTSASRVKPSTRPKAYPGIAAAIVLKNAAFYQHQDRQNPLRKAGHTLEDLPSYSPVLNPIEQTPVGADQRYP